jgi:hypothetical protein
MLVTDRHMRDRSRSHQVGGRTVSSISSRSATGPLHALAVGIGDLHERDIPGASLAICEQLTVGLDG